MSSDETSWPPRFSRIALGKQKNLLPFPAPPLYALVDLQSISPRLRTAHPPAQRQPLRLPAVRHLTFERRPILFGGKTIEFLSLDRTDQRENSPITPHLHLLLLAISLPVEEPECNKRTIPPPSGSAPAARPSWSGKS